MEANDRDYTILVDSHEFHVESPSMTGAQIKALASKGPDYQLFLELPGDQPDELISDSYSVEIKDGLRFYTVPPVTFGRT